MILYIALAIFVISIGLNIFCNVGSYHYREKLECLSYVSLAIAIMSLVVTSVMVILMMINSIAYESDLQANQQIYNSLVYQLENDFYTNENEIGKSELYSQIQEWNVDLARGKAANSNIWISNVVSDIYDAFDFIYIEDY